MEEKEINLEEEYSKFKQKYDMPAFKELTEDFDIEKIQDKESSFLLREIRRTINEKTSAYLHLFENLINPNSPPIFIFSLIRNISTENKEMVKQLYNELSKSQIEVMKLDTIYSEESEAKFIKKVFNLWQEVKQKTYKLIESLESNMESTDTDSKKAYFD